MRSTGRNSSTSPACARRRRCSRPHISYHDGTFYIADLAAVQGIDPSIFREGDHAYIVNDRAPGESTQLVDGGDERAGLAAMQRDVHHPFFGLARIAGKPGVALYTADRGEETLVASAPVTAGIPVRLTIRATGGTMAFDYRAGGQTQTFAGKVDARFVGTIAGPYAWTR